MSAARYVVASTQHLVSTANSYVSNGGTSGEETLIASARSVAASTAQLVSAWRAREPAGQGERRGINLVHLFSNFVVSELVTWSFPHLLMIGTDSLEEAARSINTATSRLVEAAKHAASQLTPERPSSASSQVSETLAFTTVVHCKILSQEIQS